MKMRAPLQMGLVLAVGFALPGHGRADYSVGVSTTAEKMMTDLTDVSKDAEVAPTFFDSSALRRGQAQPVLAKAQPGGKPAAAQAAPLSAQTKAAASVPAPATASNEPAKKQCCLDTLQSTADGNLYHMRNDRPWWKFWDSSKIIEKAVPGKDGVLYNDKDEFVGEWQKVMSVKADRFQPVKGENGEDNIYTFLRKGNGTEVARNGKYMTTFAQWTNSADLRELKAGNNNQIYARYAKDSEDVVLTLDPNSQKQIVAAKVPAELRTVQVWVPEQGHYVYDGDGNRRWQVDRFAHYESRIESSGVDKFQVGADGKVLTLFKGNVFEATAAGRGAMRAGNKSEVSPLENTPRGNISNFAVDDRGNLFLVKDGRIAVGDGSTGTVEQSGFRDPIIDNNGHVLKMEGVINQTFRRIKVAP